MPKYQLEKLESGYNFGSWEQSLTLLLNLRGLWEHVQDSTPGPQPPTSSQGDSISDYYEARIRYARWFAKDRKAKALIRRSLAHDYMAAQAGLDTEPAHIVYNNLLQRYRDNSSINKFLLYESWHRLQWDGTYFNNFWEKWKRAIVNCRGAGIEITNEIEVLTFVGMVARCGDSLFETWAAQKMMQDFGKEIPESFELLSELNGLWTSQLSIRKWEEELKKKCGVCGARNHKPSECWHLKPRLGPRRFRPNKRLVNAYKKRMEMPIEEEKMKERSGEESDDDESDWYYGD